MFCTKFRKKIKSLIRDFDNYVDENIDTALVFTIRLKAILKSIPAQLLTALIPGDLDEAARVKLLDALNAVIPTLEIVNKCKDCPSLEEKIRCYAEQLSLLHPDQVNDALRKLASRLAGTMDGERLAEHLYDTYTQIKYSLQK